MHSISQFLPQAIQAGAQAPELKPLLARLLMFFLRGFKASRDIESAFEQFIDDMTRDAAKPKPPPPPSPDQIKAQMMQQQQENENKRMEAQALIDQQKGQQEMQIAQQKAEMEAQAQAQQLQADRERMAMEMQAERDKLALARERMMLEWENMQRKQEFDASQHKMKLEQVAAQRRQVRKTNGAAHA